MVAPDTLRVFDRVGPCDLKGIFDLTLPLPCPAENPWVRAQGARRRCPPVAQVFYARLAHSRLR